MKKSNYLRSNAARIITSLLVCIMVITTFTPALPGNKIPSAVEPAHAAEEGTFFWNFGRLTDYGFNFIHHVRYYVKLSETGPVYWSFCGDVNAAMPGDEIPLSRFNPTAPPQWWTNILTAAGSVFEKYGISGECGPSNSSPQEAILQALAWNLGGGTPITPPAGPIGDAYNELRAAKDAPFADPKPNVVQGQVMVASPHAGATALNGQDYVSYGPYIVNGLNSTKATFYLKEQDGVHLDGRYLGDASGNPLGGLALGPTG